MSATTRETGSVPPPPAAANPNSSSGGPGLQLPPLRGPDSSRVDRQPDARTDLKDERRKDEREPWSMRGHGLGGGAPPSALEGIRSDRSRKRLSIGTLTGAGEQSV